MIFRAKICSESRSEMLSTLNFRNIDTKYQDWQELILVNWLKVTIFDVF